MKRFTLIALCAVLVFSLSACDKRTKEENTTVTENVTEKEQTVGVPEPGNGYVFEGITADYGSSSLTITTVGKSGHYFILDPISLYCNPFASSFEQYRTELNAEYRYIKFYVYGESTVEIQIPWGKYTMYYATGETWYGQEELFGKDTVYSRCAGTFEFSYSSTELTLHIPDGNRVVYKIEANEFPN